LFFFLLLSLYVFSFNVNFSFLIDSACLIGFELTIELDSETFSFIRNGEFLAVFFAFKFLINLRIKQSSDLNTYVYTIKIRRRWMPVC